MGICQSKTIVILKGLRAEVACRLFNLIGRSCSLSSFPLTNRCRARSAAVPLSSVGAFYQKYWVFQLFYLHGRRFSSFVGICVRVFTNSVPAVGSRRLGIGTEMPPRGAEPAPSITQSLWAGRISLPQSGELTMIKHVGEPLQGPRSQLLHQVLYIWIQHPFLGKGFPLYSLRSAPVTRPVPNERGRP